MLTNDYHCQVHVVMIVMLALPSSFLQQCIMLVMAITLIVCAGIVSCVREDYKRLEVDQQYSRLVTGGAAKCSASAGGASNTGSAM